MKKSRNRYLVWGIVILAVAGASLTFFRSLKGPEEKRSWREVWPFVGTIGETVTTTAVVEPQNRLELKSSVPGRVERILVEEGQRVRKGEVLALVSSTERAALLDAATIKGKGELDYWKNVYRETALIAPIDGQVIVRKVEPGQTVTTNDVVLVLSDRLIVDAEVDETDIGGIRVGQKATIGLDAYPDIKITGTVDHIDYESSLVNNVNIYHVEIVPDTIPEVFRSGMSASVDVVTASKERVLLLPSSAITTEGGKSVVLVKVPGREHPGKTVIRTGLQDEMNTEILAGLVQGMPVLVRDTTYSLPSNKTGTNPFLPRRPEERRRRDGNREER